MDRVVRVCLYKEISEVVIGYGARSDLLDFGGCFSNSPQGAGVFLAEHLHSRFDKICDPKYAVIQFRNLPSDEEHLEVSLANKIDMQLKVRVQRLEPGEYETYIDSFTIKWRELRPFETLRST